MSILQDPVDKMHGIEEYRDDFIKTYRRNQGSLSPKTQVEQEKRVRREIANSNERRRMQSINSGFEQIRRMLPPPQEGEKYSKATILQLAVKYIQNLETEASRLHNQLKMISPNAASINCVPVSTAAANLQATAIDQNLSGSMSSQRKRKMEDGGSPAEMESLKRRTTQPSTGMKSYEDLNSENVNLRQHLGQLSSDKDFLQRQIEYLRQQISEITSKAGNPAAQRVVTEAGSAPYTLPSVQMTLQTKAGTPSPSPYQVQKVITTGAGATPVKLTGQLPHAVRPQEIIQIPIASLSTKPGFEPFAVEPVLATRSSESASPPQPLTLTPAPTPNEQPSLNHHYQKKSLDALVLAIEQIEGTTMGSVSNEEIDIKTEAISNNNNNVDSSASSKNSTESIEVKCDGEAAAPSSEEYPIVTKLLNRPIPHKYLHRPQVVVNSSH